MFFIFTIIFYKKALIDIKKASFNVIYATKIRLMHSLK